jgi:HlyD family secretion protein
MFQLLTNRRVLLAVAVIAGLLTVALWPRALPVDVAAISRGPLVVTTDEEGRTRVRDRFVLAAPVEGRVLRIDLDAGDPVKRGQTVARVRVEPSLLDTRARAEAQASVDIATATLGRLRAEEGRARAVLVQAQRELRRTRELVAEQLSTLQELEAKEADVRAAEESLKAAGLAVLAAEADLDRARVRLTPDGPAGPARVVEVKAPTDGIILRRIRESESVVPAGDPLLEMGDPHQLEIVADLLSTEAVRVHPGARVIIEQWGGERPLDGKVRRVEPSGFTKISALGVEEQRVNVIIDFVDPPAAVGALGDGYRVEVRIVVWESPDVLKVPTSALFRVLDRWAVYVVEQGRAIRTLVDLGHQTGLEAEVVAGLTEGAQVVVHPGDALRDQARVEVRAP